MKFRYLAFLIPLFLAFSSQDVDEPRGVYKIWCNCHPSFLVEPYENEIKCFEQGSSYPGLVLKSTLANRVYDRQIAMPGSCAQCHLRGESIREEELVRWMEK
jgi:hypothetical protein